MPRQSKALLFYLLILFFNSLLHPRSLEDIDDNEVFDTLLTRTYDPHCLASGNEKGKEIFCEFFRNKINAPQDASWASTEDFYLVYRRGPFRALRK